MLFASCATTLSGRVVNPDGSALTQTEVKIYTAPRTSFVQVEPGGAFTISENVVPEQEYTLIAEDPLGNMGYVRDFKAKKGKNKGIVVRMSREIDAKDAVLEGGGPSEIERNGAGEKILKSSP
jgi:hypothetical protein